MMSLLPGHLYLHFGPYTNCRLRFNKERSSDYNLFCFLNMYFLANVPYILYKALYHPEKTDTAHAESV